MLLRVMAFSAGARRVLELLGALLIAWLVLPALPAAPADVEVVRRARPQMGTIFQVSVAARGRARADLERVVDAALDEVDRLEALFSEWRPGTEISEVNRLAGRAAVRVSPETFAIVEAAHRASVVSGGAFDVTFNALWGLWDFKSPAPKLPDPAEVARRVARIDYRKLTLDRAARSLYLARPGMKIGLGGIGQGYAADRVCEMLDAAGLPDHLIDGGGDVKACGSRGGAPWSVAIKHPRREALLCMVGVGPAAIVTSGDYERFFEIGGRRYHHIMDPRTGYPARGVVSATVIARTATEADALATAALVLGPERGLRMLEDLPGVEGLLVDEHLRTSVTSGLSVRDVPGQLPVLTRTAPGGT